MDAVLFHKDISFKWSRKFVKNTNYTSLSQLNLSLEIAYKWQDQHFMWCQTNMAPKHISNVTEKKRNFEKLFG